MRQNKIKYEIRKGKVGKFDLFIFPGYKNGDLIFPAFCVLLRIHKRLKGAVVANRAFTSVMN